MQTGENTQGLRKITDMIRNFGVLVLVLHYYVFCYGAFERWHLTHPVLERLLINIHHTGLFNHVYTSKLLALICLLISLLGTKGRKEEKLSKMRITTSFMATGILLYWGSIYLLKSISTFKIPITSLALIYIVITSLGFLLLLRGGALLTRLITLKLEKDVFNQLQESFPQEERLRSSPFSINLPAIYQLDGKSRKSWINIINPFRGTLVAGTPGSGKSYFVIRHVITQHIQKGFTMFIYDFKFDDLTKIAYNTILDNTDKYPVPPKFYLINFDDLRFTHRCNPLDPKSMT
ncbi:YWFCY domain-containing protein, partial [Arachidicoccus ginsenosidivorans]